jgi:alkanesulfonate monooxygenase SsuD/methylene tetrahydromethanopterin reductase-like flavin-dependent oxidoreductase (luciferase family)
MTMTYRFTLAYDMRAPEFGAAPVDLYRAAIQQCTWADRLGFSTVTLMEHHASIDGYLPSPIVLASALAAATERIEIALGLILLPLYHPVRLAEDLAVLDLLAEGRLRIMVGAGYREAEYDQFDLDIRRRPSMMEEGIAVLKQAWTGEPFDWRGRSIRVLPRPYQRPRPQILMGGASPASARRAARIADGYLPVAPRLYDIYLEELDALGKGRPSNPGNLGQAGIFVHIAEDPERAWSQIAQHALHETNDYAAWAAGRRGTPYRRFEDANGLRASGMYRIVTPEEAIQTIEQHGELGFKPLMGGLDPAIGWECLELFEQKVLPRLGGQGGSPISGQDHQVRDTEP